MEKRLGDVFKKLEGDWIFSRTILNLSDNETRIAEGLAKFFKKNGNDYFTLNYEEFGELSIQRSEKKIKFKRKYIYKLKEGSIDIILDDGVTRGELFQTLHPDDNLSEFNGTEHVCRLDKHNGRHTIYDDFSFSTEYTVKGPDSNLIIKTDFKKSIK